MLNKKISLLIHGPFNSNCFKNISKQLKKTDKIDEIIFSSYILDKEKTLKEIESYFANKNIKTVFVQDVFNPGFANINRQIITVRAGLNLISDENFVIKLRNDQNIDFNKLFDKIKKYNFFDTYDKKILTTCCYSRMDRLYHPSDMFLCGQAKVLKEYYSIPLTKETEIETMMYVRELNEKSDNKLKFNPISPESKLYKHFLEQNNWIIKDTYDDSFESFKKYIYLLNTWDIDLRWEKKRNYPFNKSNDIILPCFFKLEPFEGGPVEKARCFFRHYFTKDINLVDMLFIFKSKVCWEFWKANKDSSYYKNKDRLKNHIRNLFVFSNGHFIRWFGEIFVVIFLLLQRIYNIFLKYLWICLNKF